VIVLLVLITLQAWIGQATEVLTIAVHEAGPNPLVVPIASSPTVAAPFSQGTVSTPNAGALPQGPHAPSTLAYPVMLVSGRIPVPEPRWFKAKLILEWVTWKHVCIDEFCINSVYFSDDTSKIN
jgi:hypothetical protein